MRIFFTFMMMIGLLIPASASELQGSVFTYRLSGLAGYVMDSYKIESPDPYAYDEPTISLSGGLLGLRAGASIGPLIDVSVKAWGKVLSNASLGVGYGIETEIFSLLGVYMGNLLNVGDERRSGWIFGISVPLVRVLKDHWETTLMAEISSNAVLVSKQISNQMTITIYLESGWVSQVFNPRSSNLTMIADF